jgi:hypothetical protein
METIISNAFSDIVVLRLPIFLLNDVIHIEVALRYQCEPVTEGKSTWIIKHEKER